MTLTKYAALIGVVTFLLFTIAFFPASLVWYLVADRVAPHVLTLSAVEGTPWRGRAIATGEFLPTGSLEWNLRESELFSGTLAADLTLSGPAHQLTGTLRFDGQRLELADGAGWVDAEAVNSKVEPLGYQISGTLTVRTLAARAEGRWFTALHGDLEWSGGKLSYTSPLSNLLYHLPALVGTVNLEEASVAATVSEAAGAAPLFDFRLQQDGWASIAMRGRLFDLVEQPWPMQGGPGDVVMQLESQLWQ